jgi:hypothetical protein
MRNVVESKIFRLQKWRGLHKFASLFIVIGYSYFLPAPEMQLAAAFSGVFFG